MTHARPPIDDRFLPVRIEALVDAIDADAARFGPVAGWAQKIARGLERVVIQEVGELHRHLDRLYAPANPDLDALAEPNPPWNASGPRLHEAIEYLLHQASFERLSDVGVRAAIRAGSASGLRVRIRPERVERLSLHVRGRGVATVRRVDRRRPWRRYDLELPVYTRLAVVAQLKDEAGLRLKLFRDIPVADVEALLPHAEATMTMLDRAMVFGAGAGSLGSLGKVLFGGATTTSALAIPAAVGLGGMAVRSFLGYRRKKRQRTSHRTQHLYEKNLANNAAVLHTLCRMIALEESKAALLGYALLASGKAKADDLEPVARAYLAERFRATCRYDAALALGTLERLGLLEDRALAEPQHAHALVEAHWRTRDTTGHHLDAIGHGATRPQPGP
ncbi:MAG: DUF3754 domain-containing protein [Phycisphaeraceae bacterium]|nr:DUF3754 domain-containing protein [Phycisphaeraceae bacterium]